MAGIKFQAARPKRIYMIALFTIAIFFFLLVLVYPAVCALLAFAAWYRIRRVKGTADEEVCVARIEARTDQLKNKAFKISILLLFFGVAPFTALWLMTNFF